MDKKELNEEKVEVVEVAVVETENQVAESVAIEDVKAPAKYLFVMNLQRLGSTFSTMAITLSAVVCFALLGLLILPFALFFNLIIAIGIVIITLGTILLSTDISFGDLIILKPESVGLYSEYLFRILPIVLAVILGLSVVSLVALCFNRKKLSVSRIVLNCIMIVASVVGIIITAPMLGGV